MAGFDRSSPGDSPWGNYDHFSTPTSWRDYRRTYYDRMHAHPYWTIGPDQWSSPQQFGQGYPDYPDSRFPPSFNRPHWERPPARSGNNRNRRGRGNRYHRPQGGPFQPTTQWTQMDSSLHTTPGGLSTMQHPVPGENAPTPLFSNMTSRPGPSGLGVDANRTGGPGDGTRDRMQTPTPVIDDSVRLVLTTIRAVKRLLEVRDFTVEGILPQGYNIKIQSLRSGFAPLDADRHIIERLDLASKEWMIASYKILESHYWARVDTLIDRIKHAIFTDPSSVWTQACREAKRDHTCPSQIDRAMTWLRDRIKDSEHVTELMEGDWQAPLTQITIPPLQMGDQGSTLEALRADGSPEPFQTDPPLMESNAVEIQLDTEGSMLLFPPSAVSPVLPVTPKPNTSLKRTSKSNKPSPTDSLLLDSIFNMTPKRKKPHSGIRDLLDSSLLLEGQQTTATSSSLLFPELARPTGLGLKPVNTDPPLRTVHPGRGPKGSKNTWSLLPRRPTLIMGDSLLRVLPSIPDSAFQIDVFPGMDLLHAGVVLKKLTRPFPVVQRIILAAGFNDRANFKPDETAQKIRDLVEICGSKFPGALVYFPLINFSNKLSMAHQSNLRAINEIFQTHPHIPLLPEGEALFQSDQAHWAITTGEKIWRHWRTFLTEGI